MILMILKCECGFEGKIEKEDKEVTCPKCFRVYKKRKQEAKEE